MRVIKENDGERGSKCARLFASAWDRRYVRSFRAGAAVSLI